MAGRPLGRCAVVVVNFGSHDLVEANVVPVARHTPDVLVVVVDNFTTPTERAAVADLAARHGWAAVLSEGNAGFGGGVNRGVATALELGAESFLLLNPDATIDAESLRHLRTVVADDPLALVAPTVVRPDGSVWFAGADLCLDTGQMRSRRRRGEARARDARPPRLEEWLSGACLMVSAQLWRRLGGFDEEYFLYWEDVDLSHRAVAAGGRLVVDSVARAVHDEGGTQQPGGGRAKSAGYYYFNIRNRLLFAARHLDDEDLRRWVRTTLPAAREIVLRGGRRQLLRPRGPLGAAYRGTRDGLAIARAERRRRRARPA